MTSKQKYIDYKEKLIFVFISLYDLSIFFLESIIKLLFQYALSKDKSASKNFDIDLCYGTIVGRPTETHLYLSWTHITDKKKLFSTHGQCVLALQQTTSTAEIAIYSQVQMISKLLWIWLFIIMTKLIMNL